MFPDPKHHVKANRVSHYRLQYQTRRDMFAALDEMHRCRANGKLQKLIKIAEHELGMHYQIKSENLMPRRSEFTEEICNLVALAHLDKLKLPQSNTPLSSLEQLASIFRVSIDDKNAVVPYVFGVQSTYRDPAEPDTSFLVFKENINRLEKRLKYSTMSIERCHLYHEMGKQNLTQSKYDEARNFARRMMQQANGVSCLWQFLSQLLIVRADVMQKNFVKINMSLRTAHDLLNGFNNVELCRVIDTALEACDSREI